MQQMSNFLLVFIGGGLGSVVRYGIGWAVAATGSSRLPLATFLANIFACLLLGFLTMRLSEGNLSDASRLLLATGFCGGFSTFSTFTAETWQLWQAGEWFLAVFHTVLSLLFCWFFFFLGLKIGE